MSGIIINGEKYMVLQERDNLNYRSLEDNLYCMLNDIFWNGDSFECIRSHGYKSLLTNGNNKRSFEYTNLLRDHNSDFAKNVHSYLSLISKDDISFIESQTNEENQIKIDDWWNELNKLIIELDELLKMHKIIKEKENIKNY